MNGEEFEPEILSPAVRRSLPQRFLIGIKDAEDVDGVSGFIDGKHNQIGEAFHRLQRTFLYRMAEAVGRSAIRSKYSATRSAKW